MDNHHQRLLIIQGLEIPVLTMKYWYVSHRASEIVSYSNSHNLWNWIRAVIIFRLSRYTYNNYSIIDLHSVNLVTFDPNSDLSPQLTCNNEKLKLTEVITR